VKNSVYGFVSADLEIETLASLCVPGGIQTGPFGSQLHQRDYLSVGTPIITVEHLGENRILHQDLPRVSDADKERLSRYVMRKGDIIFSRVGSVDRRALVRDEEEGWLFSGRCLRVRPDNTKIDSAYLSWFFGLEIFKDYIRRHAVGATMPSLNTELLSSVPVIVPSLPEQHAIADTLGALDDKIELNRRMNRTLESMAWATYKNLKIEGGEEKTIGSVVTVVGGSTPSTANPAFWENGNVHWATPKDLAPLESPVLLDTNSQITELGLQEISSGLLPAGTVLLSSRAPIGYLAITQIPAAINQGFIAIKCTEEVPNYFVLNWLKDNVDEIIGRANGTTFLEISKSSFRPMKIVVAPPEKMRAFVAAAEPLYQKIVNNLRESGSMASLRDTLLPKLIRGEVRVRNA
jgi:type I restriction enzyme S subunit